MVKGAMKLQCLFRRFRAVIRVEKLRYRKLRIESATTIQKTFRRKLAYNRFAIIYDRNMRAKIIQYAWWCYKARVEANKRLRQRRIVKIQMIVRGKLGRKRFAYFDAIRQAIRQRRQEAVETIKPLMIGHLTRKRWKDRLTAHYSKRQSAAKVMQLFLVTRMLGITARRRVMTIRSRNALMNQEYKAARTIQCLVRRKLAYLRVKDRLIARNEEERLARLKVPYYFRLKDTYYSNQNIYHYKYCLRIQCLMRCHLARKKVARVRQQKEDEYQESLKLAQNIHNLDSESLRRLMSSKSGMFEEQILALKNSTAIKIQRIIRGFCVRRRLAKRKAIKLLKWFCMETKVRHCIRKMRAAYRLVSPSFSC
jgi:hypothetical protein